jgi:type IV pilus assembly protein PilB
LEAVETSRLTPKPTSRIGEILVRTKAISRDQLEKALQRQQNLGGGKLGEHLIALGFIDEQELTLQLGRQFGIPVVDLGGQEIPPEVLTLIPQSIVRKNQILPLSLSGSTLTVSVADPTDHVSVNEVKFLTGYEVRVTLAPVRMLQRTIEKLLDRDHDAYSSVLRKLESDQLEILRQGGAEESGPVDVHELEREGEDAPVVALVNAIFADAVKKRASDIHIEPYEKLFRVRFRIDGVLQEIMKPPVRLKNAMVSRIKIMADLDIAERRLAHDGRIKLKMGLGQEIDVRVSILPIFGGEKVVLRLLDKTRIELDLGKLGFSELELGLFRAAFTKPFGMLLVTGPTGSGKTTTLYSVLSELNKPTVNISTAEDPVEYNIAGINQVSVHEDIGRTFSYCLRAFLRQDPDVIMVGEVRDFETGEIALRAALTGHLVLSTLHTNDAPSTVARLLNMGFEPFLLVSALNLVIAQRLIRRLCPRCKKAVTVDAAELLSIQAPEAEIADYHVHHPVGCDECSGTGYHGRLAIYEILSLSDEIRRFILQANDGGAGLKAKAIEAGMRTLRQAALTRVKEGITSIEEVIRVTAPD